MLKKGENPITEDIVSAEEEIKDPFVLEFPGLKDEYSESDLEEALINHLEKFLLELGGDFAFVGRQKRLRIGATWYRVDLLFFHRKLRCLVIIDLKVGIYTHADTGQTRMYLNYIKENWMNKDENPPVGLILCMQKDRAVLRYALEGLSNKVLAAKYRITAVLFFVVIIFYNCLYAQDNKAGLLEERVQDVMNLFRPDPGNYENYFAGSFLSQVSS